MLRIGHIIYILTIITINLPGEHCKKICRLIAAKIRPKRIANNNNYSILSLKPLCYWVGFT
jgi:hypothetical protein